MGEPRVTVESDGRGVATIALNRAEVRNAYDAEMIAALGEAFDRLGSDEAVRVIVLRGNGHHFQAGADLAWIDAVRAQSEAENVAVSRRTAEAVLGIQRCPKPVVALVHGGCYGGGVGLVAACDVVVASADARFAITEARWGLVADIIVPQLNGAMGVRQVRRYALTCETFDAERAREVGLVHEVCPTGELDRAAEPVIAALLATAPGALAATKRSVLTTPSTLPDEAGLEVLVTNHSTRRRSAEASEGLASFRDRRAPSWAPPAPEADA